MSEIPFAPELLRTRRDSARFVLSAIVAACGVATFMFVRRAPVVLDACLPVLLLAAATLVSEDLTCITAGELIRRGQMHWLVGVFGCLLGIYFGDLALWYVGRTVGHRVLRWRWVSRRVSWERVERMSEWFGR